MKMSTIEQTLTALASIDEVGAIELTFDGSIYSLAAVTAAAADSSQSCAISVIDSPIRRIRITAVDPKGARQSIGGALAALAKFAGQTASES